MPPPYTGMDDDDFTTDSNTVMTKAIMTKDGKCVHHPWVELRGKDASGRVFQRDSCPECNKQYEVNKESLRLRKLDLDRQLQALEISTVGGGGGGGGNSVDSRELLVENKSSSQQQHQISYRPPLPPQAYYGAPIAPGYPPYPPLPHHSPHLYQGAGGGVGAAGQERDATPNGPHLPPPFNPYDPHYFAAAAAAYHHQQSSPLQPSHTSDPSQDNYLLKLLHEKEEELKSVRKTLEETQAKLQEQSLQAARSQATLDQIQSSFQQERQLIQLQAEKRAQEQFQAQQQDILQKQLDLMDKWQGGQGGGGANTSTASTANAAEAPPPVLDEPPAPEAPSSSPSITTASIKQIKLDSDVAATTSNGKSEKLYPWKKKSAGESEAVSATMPSSGDAYETEEDKIKDAASLNGKFQPSMDESLFDSAGTLQPSNLSYAGLGSDGSDYEDEENREGEIVEAAKTAQLANELGDSAPRETISAAGSGSKATTNGATQKASDRFTPVYVEQSDKATAAEHAEYIMNNPPDDEKSLGQTVASSTYGEDRQKVVNKSILDPYGDKGTFTGVVLRSTGMPHGLGRMIYEEDGRIYEGDWYVAILWTAHVHLVLYAAPLLVPQHHCSLLGFHYGFHDRRHGRWHGYGRASFSNGDSYEGEYKFDQRHGRGVYKWHDGRVFDGQFSEDKRHGKGIFTWPDGAVYDGEFVNGQREGHGKYTFADGGQYDGSWKDGRYDGFGTCTWEDGRRYRGEWRNGMAHGRGIETYPNGDVRHEGQWIDDEPIR